VVGNLVYVHPRLSRWVSEAVSTGLFYIAWFTAGVKGVAKKYIDDFHVQILGRNCLSAICDAIDFQGQWYPNAGTTGERCACLVASSHFVFIRPDFVVG
jgi:hypothetical protein